MKAISLDVNQSMFVLPPWECLVDRYLSNEDLDEDTRQTYRRRLRRFVRWAQDHEISVPREEDILQYKRSLRDGGLTAYSQANYLVAVRRFFVFLESSLIFPNVARNIRSAKSPKMHRRDPFLLSQAKELLASIDQSTLKGKRDFAIINLMLRRGLRTCEVVRASVCDLRQSSGTMVLWVHGKGRTSADAAIVMSEETLQPIREYLALRGRVGSDDPLFASTSEANRGESISTGALRKMFQNRLRAVNLNGLRTLSAHSTRHSSITWALINGASLDQVQSFARHADPRVTQRYDHARQRIAGIAEKKIDEFFREHSETPNFSSIDGDE